MHPIVRGMEYEVTNIPLSEEHENFDSFHDEKGVQFLIRLYKDERENDEMWLDFIMQTMETDVLMQSLGVPSEPDSMSCLRDWMALLLDIGLAIGYFEQSENGESLKAVDILYLRDNHDKIAETREFYSTGVKPFQNYLKLINKGHRHYWFKANKNKKIRFMAAVGLIIDPKYRDEPNMQKRMMKKRHLIAACVTTPNRPDIVTIFVKQKNENRRSHVILKYEYKILHTLYEGDETHDIQFLNNKAFKICFGYRVIKNKDAAAKHGVGGNAKMKARVCSQATVSEPPESPKAEFLTPESLKFNFSGESSKSSIFEPDIDIKIESDSD